MCVVRCILSSLVCKISTSKWIKEFFLGNRQIVKDKTRDEFIIRDVCIIIFWALVIFGVNIWGYDLWSPDEPRYAEVAREMITTGDYLVPRVNGIPYFEKPPLLMWLMVIFSLPFGDVTEVSARVPSVLSGVGVVVLTYFLALELFGRRIAWLSALILMTMQRIWWQARFGQIDMLLTFFLTLCLYAFLRWQGSGGRRNSPWLFVFYGSIAGALLSKGVGTLAFPVLFIITYLLFEKRRVMAQDISSQNGAIATTRKNGYLMAFAAIRDMRPIIGGLIVFLPYIVWYVYARWTASAELRVSASQIVTSDLFKQTIGRFIFGVSHPQAPWYYFITVPIDMFPWTLFLLWIIPYIWKEKNSEQNVKFLLYWVVPAFVFFSIAIGKRAIYLLPIFPALAILAGCSLENFDDEATSTPRWRNLQRILWLITLIILTLAPHAVIFSKFANVWNPYWLLLTVVGIITIVDTLLAFYQKLSSHRSLLTQIPQHTSIFFITISLVVMPAVNQVKSVRSFCEPLRKLSEAGISYEAYSLGFEEEEYTFYAKHYILPFLGERDLDKIILQSNIPYKKLQTIVKIHNGFKRVVSKVPISNITSPTEAELNALKSTLSDFRNAIETPEIKDLAKQLETLLQEKLEELYDILSSDKPAFLLIREEDWKWVLAFKPELAGILKPVSVRSQPKRTLYLLANLPAFSVVSHN